MPPALTHSSFLCAFIPYVYALLNLFDLTCAHTEGNANNNTERLREKSKENEGDREERKNSDCGC